MVPLSGNRDSAAASGNYQVAGIDHGADGFDFNDLHRFRGSYHTAVTSAGIFFHNIAEAFFHLLRLFGVYELADRLGRIRESGIILVNAYLSDHGCNRYVCDIPVQQLFAKRILQVIPDISLTHGNADGERRIRLCLILMGEGDHSVIHHADLRAVSMGNDNLTAVFDQIYDRFGGNLHGCHLFRQSVAKGIAAKSDHDSLFLFHNIRFLLLSSYLNTLGVLFSSSFLRISAGSANFARKIIAAMMYGLKLASLYNGSL